MINDHSRASLIKLIQKGDDKLKMVQIFNAIQMHGPIGRRQISKITGIYHCSIPRLVIKLKQYNLIKEETTAKCEITGRNVGMLLSIYKPPKNTYD